MKNFLSLGIVLLTSLGSLFAQHTGRIWGVVFDNTNQSRIKDAEISIVGSQQTVKTDASGNFILLFDNPTNATQIDVWVNRTGYQRYHRNISLPINAPLDIRLANQNTAPAIAIEQGIIGNIISGTVTGFSQESIAGYKVVVYVFTNQYYIHPYPETYSDTTATNIAADGTWQVTSVRHPGPCPTKILAAIVRVSHIPPSIISGPQNNFIKWIECTSCIKCQ